MSLSAQPFDASHRSLHRLASDVCPTCEQIIPNDRLEQVRSRQIQHQRELEGQYALKMKAEREHLTAQLQQQNEDALAKLRQEGEAKVAAARIEEQRAANAQAEVTVAAANTAMETMRSQGNELKRQLEASDAATTEKVAAAQEAARKEAEHTVQVQLAAAHAAAQQAQEQVRALSENEQNAQARILQLEQQAQELRGAHEKALQESIQKTREALENGHRDAINAEQAKRFEEKQKLQNTVDDLKRQLENKTALELGEGAEVDLFEALKEAFPDDDIIRIKRGVAGADIRHVVRHNGKHCGQILYDSKNHKTWRNEFVTKLRDDQIAGKADHAILSTLAFPQGTKQLHVQDGIVLVNPARAVAVAEIVRRQVLQAYCLNLSNDDREQKSLELYSFITSERFGVLMTKLSATTDSLNDLDAREQATHNAVWQRRGKLIGSVAKAEADLRFEIDRIIGTADETTQASLTVALSADAAGTGA